MEDTTTEGQIIFIFFTLQNIPKNLDPSYIVQLYNWSCFGRKEKFQSSIGITKFTVFLRLKDGVFSFQNNPKDLDPSCKMDLDLWDCLGRVKLVS